MGPMASEQFDRLAVKVLQGLAQGVGQAGLYRASHPAVLAALRAIGGLLAEVLAQAGGEVSFSLDQDKWLANGRLIAEDGKIPRIFTSFFSRLQLSSITFKTGVTPVDLAAFCELAALRPEAVASWNPQDFLKSRGITHIGLNEAVYVRVNGEAPAPGSDVSVPDDLSFQGQTIDKAIEALVSRAVPEAGLRAAVIARVKELVQEDLRRRVEEATRTIEHEKTILRGEQVRTKAVVENIADGVVVVDGQGRILMMNPAAERIYGKTLAQAAGQPLSAQTGEGRMVTLAGEVSPAAGLPAVDVQAAADIRRTLRAAGAVVQNEAGKVVGMVSTLSDEAKYKEMQRMQEDFVAHVTHELRAPLSSIRAALEILEGQSGVRLDADGSKMVGTAIRNSDRLADMINSILDFSKLESGQMTVAPKPTDPEGLAREAAESLRPWASKKGIEIVLLISPGQPLVLADGKRTIQVLINIISNAVKFTPSEGRITVALAPCSDSTGKFVRFSVTDTGPGIAKADQKKIFDKFVQIATGERQPLGTGLGLSIAKALAHLQGGKLWVESDLGQGAAFFFTLPVFAAPRREAETVSAPRPWLDKILGR